MPTKKKAEESTEPAEATEPAESPETSEASEPTKPAAAAPAVAVAEAEAPKWHELLTEIQQKQAEILEMVKPKPAKDGAPTTVRGANAERPTEHQIVATTPATGNQQRPTKPGRRLTFFRWKR